MDESLNPGQAPRSRPWQRNALLFTVGALLLLFTLGLSCGEKAVNVTLSEAIALSQAGRIREASINSNNGIMLMVVSAPPFSPLSVIDSSGNTVKVENGRTLSAYIDSMTVTDLQELGFVLPSIYSTNSAGGGSMTMLLWIFVPILLLSVIMFVFLRPKAHAREQQQTMGMSRSRARVNTADRPKVTFADVAGADEAKEDLKEVVDFLKDRSKFQAIGATIPKGMLLVGPPGTGKTLLARAVAGEADVPFFSVSGSEFVEMFVGVGAARVRDLFDQAKRSSPSIIFIDEIDAVGRARSGATPGSHEEREQTLNQILVEMDGFEANIGVIVLAATNRADILDAALLRPGRFDRRVMLDRPDSAGRLAILKIHARGKKLDPSVDLSVVARQTHGFSGADLANLMNEAAILAVRRDKETVSMSELTESVDRVIAGPERKSLRVNPKDKETTAYHESGHALVAHMLPNVAPVHKISIVARGSMGGYTRLLNEDRYFTTASQFKDTLAVLLGGHAAEELLFGEASTGPHSDITQATDIARKMVTDYGMSKKLGLRTFGHSQQSYFGEERNYSEMLAQQIDIEVCQIIDSAHHVAKRVLLENKARLIHLATKLLEVEALESPLIELIFSEPLSEGDLKVASALPDHWSNGQDSPLCEASEKQ